MKTLSCVTLCLIFSSCGLQPGTPLQTAAANNDAERIGTLIQQGADVNEMGAHGVTPIISAARSGAVDVIRVLAKHGADLNVGAGVNNWTPLMHAIHKNRIESVRALLDAGIDINARGGRMGTALMMAAGYGYTAIVNLLLERGADAYTQFEGMNALSFAVLGVPDIDRFTVADCQADTVKALLARVPDLRLPDSRPSLRRLAALKLKSCAAVAGNASMKAGNRGMNKCYRFSFYN
jgi:hypothetical protein